MRGCILNLDDKTHRGKKPAAPRIATQNKIGESTNGFVRMTSADDVGAARKPFKDWDGYREKLSRMTERMGGIWLPVAENR